MNDSLCNRRDLLIAGAAAATTIMAPPFHLYAQKSETKDFNKRALTAIILGAGNRGSIYANYALENPQEMKVIGLAEPIKERNSKMASKHKVNKENRFSTWEDVFKKPKFADAVIISTPDELHYGPAIAALNAGYDLLLEKPIARQWEECKEILELATKLNRIVAVCHVLRYAPYYIQIKKIIESGEIGEVVSVHHLEPINHIHFSHSYVRGIWRNKDVASPLILAKSCHDLDILNWWIDKNCTRINMFGDQRLFVNRMAPEGATERCVDCPVNKTCAFSAMKIYLWDKRWGSHYLVKGKASTDENILKALKEGEYGKCVFKNDNNQPDHLTLNMKYEDGTTVTMGCEALTSYGRRRTRIMGTKGDIVGNGKELSVANFAQNKNYIWNVDDYARKHQLSLRGHGGGDMLLVRDFVRAVQAQDSSLLSSSLEVSMASHLMGFEAEESRLNDGETRDVKL